MAKRGRQLQLFKDPPAERRAGARRDFSKAEFERALARNGFTAVNPVQFADATGAKPGVFNAAHRNVPPLRIARRATLALLLRWRGQREVSPAQGGQPAHAGEKRQENQARSHARQGTSARHAADRADPGKD